MGAVATGATVAQPEPRGLTPLGEALLARIAVDGGATRSEIVADLAPLFAHKLSPAEWRRVADLNAGHVVEGGFATESRGRLKATETGLAAAQAFLGWKGIGGAAWPQIRDVALVAKGLKLEGESGSRLKMLARPEGMRALILQKAFKLAGKKNPSPAKLRAQLALVALERAFGNKVKAGLGKGSAFTAKAGRTLAGQLSVNPRDVSTDQKLIAQLAAEQVGAVQQDLDALRAAILKSLGTAVLAAESASEPQVVKPSPERLPPPANDTEPAVGGPSQVAHASRPGLNEFTGRVMAAARTCAEGWPGNRKAFISHVWQAIRRSEKAWDLSEIEFKCMLAEAHRTGAVVLANADLKDKKRKDEFESSAIVYKNTVWHFVRVED